LIFKIVFTIIRHGGPMKKLIVKDGCIGCGACVAIDSEHFDFNEDGLSNVISNENLETDELKNAMTSCPVNVIKFEESECNCNDNCPCGEDCNCGDDCQCGEGCNCHN